MLLRNAGTARQIEARRGFLCGEEGDDLLISNATQHAAAARVLLLLLGSDVQEDHDLLQDFDATPPLQPPYQVITQLYLYLVSGVRTPQPWICSWLVRVGR